MRSSNRRRMEYQPPSKRPKIHACVNCGIPTEDRFCELCLALTECKQCHKRLRRDLFCQGSSKCLTCANKRSFRGKYTFDNVFTVTTIPTDESCRDLEAYILGSRDLILEAIAQAIQVENFCGQFANFEDL